MAINDVFEALSHPVRREILALLKKGPQSAGELAAQFDLTKPTMSVHFAKLKTAGLVTIEKKGTSVIYHVHLSVLEDALSGLLSLRSNRK